MAPLPDPSPDVSTGAPTAGLAETTISRVWELRRQAEKQAGGTRVAVGALVAVGIVVIASPGLVPGGVATTLVGFLAVAAIAITGGFIASHRASVRGHTGTIESMGPLRHRWWRNPALVGPAIFTVVFLGNLFGVLDNWPVIIGCAVAMGCATALVLPRYETADHLTGSRLENPPELTTGTVTAVAEGELAPDVLELLLLQHHTGERRIAWCADVLNTEPADIRGRIARGRRWLELPATEVHDPAAAGWVRLTADGREALGYV
ncbi:hypothetical protein [Dietzia sp. ANT_WB102]|uniref:hypothetical protein n=1 Tax=Dietzia sp. ANT_WB102 TaxID=2597345 RepID=UPI0011EFCEED|nr:hypothetical protein [Dietzia sp. ANT_WB102]KAA0916957.1 hypothetical protein FQ137_11965 [Dietzia sp. ANT_WB102]